MSVKTVDLPAIGKVKSTYVYVGAAAAAGIVVYAWWTRGGAPGPSPADEILYDEYGNPIGVVGQDYKPPSVTGGGQEIDDNRPVQPVTNSEWTLLATAHLTTNGFEPLLVMTALGKFLNRQALNASEAGAVQAAIAAYGQPPQGGPYVFTPHVEPPAPKTPPAKPGNIRGLKGTAFKRGIWWDWRDGPGVKPTQYKVWLMDANGTVIREVVVAHSDWISGGLVSGRKYSVKVRPVRSGVWGPVSHTITRTPK